MQFTRLQSLWPRSRSQYLSLYYQEKKKKEKEVSKIVSSDKIVDYLVGSDSISFQMSTSVACYFPKQL